MERPTMRFAAMLVAGVAGLAPTLAGCGQTEPSKSTNQGATNAPSTSEPTATTAVLPETVDFNNPKELAAALASLGVETPAVEPSGVERSVVDGVAFPTWPTGDVRKAGLKTFRVDVSTGFDGKASLKFFQGKKELYSAPFDPAKTETIATIPAVVVESLKTGDKVTWGVYFEKKSVKPITVEFTIVDKAAAARKLGEIEANKGLSNLGRMIAKAQVLKNYSFLSEAVATYVEVTKADDSITSVYTDIVDCLRRLKLKNTPLFADAQLRSTSTPSPSRKGFGPVGLNGGVASGGPSSGDIPSGNRGGMAPIGPAPVMKTAGNGGGLKQGGGGLPPIPTPPAPVDPTVDPTTTADPMDQGLAAAKALAQAALVARNRADAAQHAADLAKKLAGEAQAEADAQAAKVTEFTTKAAEARAKATDMSNGLTEAERKNLMDQANALEQAAAAAKAAADAAAATASEKALMAEKLAHNAQQLDNEADTLEQNAKAALGVVDPTNPGGSTGPKNGATPPPGTGPLDPTLPKSWQMQDKINALTKVVQAAQANLASAEKRVNDAQAAFNLTQGPPMAPSEVVTAAKAELDAAQQALADAGSTLETAQKALNEASK